MVFGVVFVLRNQTLISGQVEIIIPCREQYLSKVILCKDSGNCLSRSKRAGIDVVLVFEFHQVFLMIPISFATKVRKTYLSWKGVEINLGLFN